MLGSGIAMSQICCRIVVSSSVGGVRWWCLYNMSVAGVRVVEFRPKSVADLGENAVIGFTSQSGHE